MSHICIVSIYCVMIVATYGNLNNFKVNFFLLIDEKSVNVPIMMPRKV